MTYDFFFVLLKTPMKPIALYPHQVKMIEDIQRNLELQKKDYLPTIIVPCKPLPITLTPAETEFWPHLNRMVVFPKDTIAATSAVLKVIDNLYPPVCDYTEVSFAKLDYRYSQAAEFLTNFLPMEKCIPDSNGNYVGLQINKAIRYYRKRSKQIPN